MSNLDRIEALLISNLEQSKEIKLVLENNKNGDKEHKYESKVLTSMRKYLDDNYYRGTERFSTTDFHSALAESLKEEGLYLDVKVMPSFMLHIFGIDRIKSSGKWYYVGLVPKHVL